MRRKNTIDRVYLKKPCSTEWDLMKGNEQVRFCTECNKHVHNISALTREQADDLLVKAGGQLCGKFDRDDLGKIITADQLTHSSLFRIQLPGFTSAVVAMLLGTGITVQGEHPGQSNRIVSASSAKSLKENLEKTQSKDGKPAIIGTVFDVKKAVIAGAKVTLINEKSNRTDTVTTSEAGQYLLEKIEPGTYTIKIASPGFVSFKKTGIELRANEQSRMDVTLQAGTLGGLAILPDSDNSRPMSKFLSSSIRAIKRVLAVNS